jgi:hypothetical protein
MEFLKRRPKSKNPRGWSFVGLITCCLLVGIVSASYLRRARSNGYKVVIPATDGPSSSIDFSLLEGVTLLNLNSGHQEPISLRSSCNTLVIIFSPGDCPNCLRERTVWEDLAKSYDPSRLRVMSVLVNTSRDEAKSFTKAFNTSIAVYFDESGQLRRGALVPPITPFKTLIARDTGVLLAEGPNPRTNEQAEFGRKLQSEVKDCEK